MSNLVSYLIKNKSNYSFDKKLSNELVNLALICNKGIVFNFLGYDEELINQFDHCLYFSITDDFLQLNSEFASNLIIYDFETKKGIMMFEKDFSIFDMVADHLYKNNIKEFDVIISTNEGVSKENLYLLTCNTTHLTKTMIDYLISNKDKNGFSFEDVLIQVRLE